MRESKKSKFEGLHYEILMEYINTGNTKNIEDPEMVEYLEQLDKIRGWFNSLMSKEKIIRAIMLQFNITDERTAESRYIDTLNYFYADTDIRKETWRNIYAEKLDKLANAAILSAKEVKDYKIAKELIMAALEARGANKEDVDKLPDHIFKQRQPVYVMDPTMLGLPKADRNELARQIEAFPLKETVKEKLKQEAGAEDFNIDSILKNE